MGFTDTCAPKIGVPNSLKFACHVAAKISAEWLLLISHAYLPMP